VLLQILDDGRLTDSQGRTVDFKNTVIIMTSNVGSQALLEVNDENREMVEARVMAVLRDTFKPEFLNRVDDVIMFNPLTEADLRRIVDLQLAHVQDLLVDRRVTLDVTPEAKDLLVAEGYDPIYGARPLKRVIQRLVQNPLALAMLEGAYGEGDTIRVTHEAGAPALGFERVPAHGAGQPAGVA
jgi:ATP-dependent Clp protease ATP-binding subunit ClpB